jgi:hypothetical protein
MRLWTPKLAALAVVILAHSAMGAAAASAAQWNVSHLDGTVLRLVGDEWVELSAADPLTGVSAIRTLKGASLDLELEGLSVHLGPEVALRVSIGPKPAQSKLELYSGAVTVTSSLVAQSPAIDLGTISVNDLAGTAVFQAGAGGTSARILVGSAELSAPNARKALTITAGETVLLATDAATPVLLAGDGEPVALTAAYIAQASNGQGVANGFGAGAGNNNAGGNGNGNGGTNGNAGGNGNGGGGSGGGSEGGNGNGGNNGNENGGKH